MEEQNNNEEIQLNDNSQLINEAEWVFQFDNDEEQFLAVTPEDRIGEPLSITIALNNTLGSDLTFTSPNGKVFRMYAREITEKGRLFREQQSQTVNTTDETEN
jgi:biotin-(acetyl-CoA carboxylase) ligase